MDARMERLCRQLSWNKWQTEILPSISCSLTQKGMFSSSFNKSFSNNTRCIKYQFRISYLKTPSSYYGPEKQVFFPYPEVVFRISDSQYQDSIHIPLLITPFNYNTYRGQTGTTGGSANAVASISLVLYLCLMMFA